MKNIWEKAVEKLKSKISDQNINTWIKPIQTKEISDDHIILEVPNKFIKDWVKENYNQIILKQNSQNISNSKYGDKMK